MKRSKFSLSYDNSLTMNQGMLTPIGLTEVLPGDTVQHATQALIRMAPLNAPIMHPTHAKIMHFFVPHRIVWDDWENFVTRGPDGDSAPVFPTVTLPLETGIPASSLANYLGLPVVSPGGVDIEASALPFRGYALIFNEFFRDQDLVDPLPLDTSSGPDITTNTALVPAAWEKDYLTSSRLFTQKGPEVTIPILGDAPVKSNATFGTPGNNLSVQNASGSYKLMGADANYVYGHSAAGTEGNRLYADMSAVTGIDVNELRLALALQRYEEARARFGSRYVEYLRYLGVKSSDARLQRPEYLGGGKQTIQFSEVLRTAGESETTGETVGSMYGHGIAALTSNRYRRFFEEHGYVFSFMVVRPKAIYANGIPRHWNRRTFVDFWQKELEHIGQQEVLNKEVFAASAAPNGTFGFQDRYDEYRRNESRVSGEFATVLNYWTQARIFSDEPTLNDDFVNCIPDPRIFQSTETDQLYCMVRHSMQARRLVAKTGSSFIF